MPLECMAPPYEVPVAVGPGAYLAGDPRAQIEQSLGNAHRDAEVQVTEKLHAIPRGGIGLLLRRVDALLGELSQVNAQFGPGINAVEVLARHWALVRDIEARFNELELHGEHVSQHGLFFSRCWATCIWELSRIENAAGAPIEKPDQLQREIASVTAHRALVLAATSRRSGEQRALHQEASRLERAIQLLQKSLAAHTP